MNPFAKTQPIQTVSETAEAIALRAEIASLQAQIAANRKALQKPRQPLGNSGLTAAIGDLGGISIYGLNGPDSLFPVTMRVDQLAMLFNAQQELSQFALENQDKLAKSYNDPRFEGVRAAQKELKKAKKAKR